MIEGLKIDIRNVSIKLDGDAVGHVGSTAFSFYYMNASFVSESSRVLGFFRC